MDDVFRALADPTRRKLLDALLEEDGQSLSALGDALPMTRFGVMKHLRVLEQAGLVVTRRKGRKKLHFLNSDPIRDLHEQWVAKYATAPRPVAVAGPVVTQDPSGEKVFETYVASAPGRLWAAIAHLPEAVNLLVDPPRRLVQRLELGGGGRTRRVHRVTWEIVPLGRACRLTLRRARPPERADPDDEPDWGRFLARLGATLGGNA